MCELSGEHEVNFGGFTPRFEMRDSGLTIYDQWRTFKILLSVSWLSILSCCVDDGISMDDQNLHGQILFIFAMYLSIISLLEVALGVVVLGRSLWMNKTSYKSPSVFFLTCLYVYLYFTQVYNSKKMFLNSLGV